MSSSAWFKPSAQVGVDKPVVLPSEGKVTVADSLEPATAAEPPLASKTIDPEVLEPDSATGGDGHYIVQGKRVS